MSFADELAQIFQVNALYGHVIDRRQWDRIGEVYAQDAIYDSARGGVLDGIAAIVEYLSSSEQPLAHHVTNIHVELEPGGTRARVIAKFFILRRDGEVGSGDYEDSWVKLEQGWRIWRRKSTRRAALRLGEPAAGAPDDE